MIIHEIDLSGIRSWLKGKMSFPDGFTVVLGPKGAGKSSIVKGLIFGLLGERAVTDYASLLRDGATKGSVELLVSSEGHTHKIVRGLIRKNGRISQDPTKLRMETDGVTVAVDKSSALSMEISNRLGQNKELIYNTWYVKQEELKTLLDMEPGRRKPLVDKLFGFEAYNRAYIELADIERDRGGQLKQLKEIRDGFNLRALQKGYNDTVQRISELKTKDREIQKQLKQLRKAQEKAEKDLQRYDELQRSYTANQSTLEEKRRSLEVAHLRVENSENELKNTIEEISNRKKRLSELEAELGKLWEGMKSAGLDDVKDLTSLDEKISETADNIEKFNTDVEADRRLKADLQKKEAELKDKDTCVYCGQELSGYQAVQFRMKRTEEINQLTARIAENSAELTNLKEIKKILDALKEKINGLNVQKEIQVEGLKQIVQKQSELEADDKKSRIEMKRLSQDLIKLEKRTPKYEQEKHLNLRKVAETVQTELHERELKERDNRNNLDSANSQLDDYSKELEKGKEAITNYEKFKQISDWIGTIRLSFKEVLPELRQTFLEHFQSYINDIYSRINPAPPMVEIDDNYTPYVKLGAVRRSAEALSGGERTDLAVAYRIGLGNAVSEAMRGKPMELLFLDEPTENLGDEDQSIQRLALMLSKLDNVKQIIAITHNPSFSQFAAHVIEVNKRGNTSRIKTKN